MFLCMLGDCQEGDADCSVSSLLPLSAGQMIFVPSYLDYVRLRSFFRAEGMDFEGLSEYADGAEVARGRSRSVRPSTPPLLLLPCQPLSHLLLDTNHRFVPTI